MKSYLKTYTNAAPLAVFRIAFGLLMGISLLRFWLNGWIEKFYIQPSFHFTYYNFSWITPLGNFTYLLFAICLLSALLVALGFKYRWAIIVFFFSFTYIELLDKTTYLNHYYFISVLSFLLIFLPCNAQFSLDNLVKKTYISSVPRWTIDSIKFLLALVYFYAGLAKINSDWLLGAMPLKIWLPSKYDLPLLGETFLQQDWFYYFLSWAGMLYDLSIPFLLFYRKTRIFGFALVVFFHLFTRVLFPIGMFPYIMIVSALIFFDAKIHIKILKLLHRAIQWIKKDFFLLQNAITQKKYVPKYSKITYSILVLFFAVQILFPWRYLLYPGELFWREEGFRFSWRVMLIEKMGYANFKIVNPENKQSFYVNNEDFLTPFQIKQMSFQPDFILEYAHHLGDYYKSKGIKNVQVYVECYVALNGKLSQMFIDPTVDLYQEKESFKPKTWILPSTYEIKGL